MKYYATLLNLSEAHEFSLNEKDVFDPLLQRNIMDRILCGSGKTENEAQQYAMENLIDEGVLETCKCYGGVKDILTKLPGKKALRHLWLHHDEYHGDSKLYAIAYHNSLIGLCERYNLPEEAQRELESLIGDVMNTAN